MTRRDFALCYGILAVAIGGLLLGALPRLDASLARQAVDRQEAFVSYRGIDMVAEVRP